ncbi:transcriptional regulator BetI [Mesorhizobium sp. B2-4-2]|nr:transcriptional regulator BetI [Mesorhizobium sp. B2-6-4]TPK45784.1 transcriptional regulator BetI [Mesorhizobium sp. B2-5-2]TPL16442.1 transcriptional regulator BetI [Mesorhizobium sp. B2-4-9]TPL16644.1 transcriptional regulator BetI [Mesorhizobium sp. B2-4-7]TPL31075.1 transcriptional regulator BetI [Mesorhizobium sp. B2-4-8]TPL33277.1 transcriptional regulator BetI [Mesorhizobium sp. B2-4-5]TPL47196.1 transcriptional regulator BetI [Mesorhizobium sp. B2-4-2]TPL59629.1 transcriptional r
MTAPMKIAARQEQSAEASSEPEKRGRKASKEVRQLQLIEATIDSLAKRGYSETTMADVADGAGLSRGIVNFHFESKEKLLIATLQHMYDEYSAHWRNALEKAGNDPADQLRTLVAADFDRSICNKRKLAAWCAFWGEAKSRPTYQALSSARDAVYQNIFIELCATLKQSGGYDYEPQVMALALSAMLEGLWLRLMMGTEDTTRESALQAANEFLSAAFPKHYQGAAATRRKA